MSLRVWLVRVIAVALAAGFAYVGFYAFVAVLFSGLGSAWDGGQPDPTEIYLRVRLQLAGVYPAALGIVAALLLLPNARASHKGALVLAGIAGLLVVLFGPLTWSPPSSNTAEGADFWTWGALTPFALLLIGGHVLVALLAWYRLRRPVDPYVPGTGVVDAPIRPAKRIIGFGAGVERAAGSLRTLRQHPELLAAWLLIAVIVGGLSYGGWSLYDVSTDEAIDMEHPGLAWAGLGWLAVSIIPTAVGLWRLRHERAGAQVFLWVGALSAIGGVVMHGFSW